MFYFLQTNNVLLNLSKICFEHFFDFRTFCFPLCF